MQIKNSNYVQRNLDQQTRISYSMPKSKFAEILDLQASLGRRLSEDIYAEREYPPVALSAINGKILNIKQDITTVEQYKEIKDRVLGVLRLGENPFEVRTDLDFIAPISEYMKVGHFANTVITLEQMLPWFNAAFLSPQEGDVLVEIKKGQGVIEPGNDYKQDKIVLAKDEVITSSKKALLKQSGVDQVIIYKDIRIAVLCVDYDLENMNNRIEFEYIQDCLKSWGYEFEILRIKPHKDTPVQNYDKTINDASIAEEFKIYIKNIQQITKEYDYIVACGLVDNGYFHQLGLLRGINELYKIYEHGAYNQKIQFIANHFKMFTGKSRTPEKRETENFFNENGLPIGQKSILYEDRAVMSYIPGYILDVIVNMHLFVKPKILQRMYGKPFLPNWKVGLLTHAYTFKIEEGYKQKILWAYVTQTIYGELNRITTKEIPELKIITVENERPDMLHFMKDCNCFIPLLGEDHELKAGDYLYYLEI